MELLYLSGEIKVKFVRFEDVRDGCMRAHHHHQSIGGLLEGGGERGAEMIKLHEISLSHSSLTSL